MKENPKPGKNKRKIYECHIHPRISQMTVITDTKKNHIVKDTLLNSMLEIKITSQFSESRRILK